MKAIAVAAVDARPELTDLPRPTPGRGQVLVKVEAASVNPVDRNITTSKIATIVQGMGGYHFPVVLGIDGAGVVSEVGPEVHRLKIGDRVMGQFMFFPLQSGTYAEYATAPETNGIVRIPEGWNASTAAAVPTAATTASVALDLLGLDSGQSVLIIGATGGVGSFAVQMAVARGLTVIATAREGAEGFVRGLGASLTIDYVTHSIAEGLSKVAPRGIDGLLDLMSLTPEGFMQHVTAARPRRAAACASTDAPTDHSGEVAIRTVTYDSVPELLEKVVAEILEGNLRVVIEREVRLEEAVAALDRNQKGGARGKTTILV